MMMCRIFPVVAAAALLSQGVSAGKLDDFEEKAGNQPEQKRESRSKRHNDYDSFGSGTYPSDSSGRSFLESFWFWVVSSPFEYRHDDPSANMLSGEELYAELLDSEEQGLHRTGQPIVPYVMVDYNWQYIDSNLDARDLQLEVGYKALAFHGRHTRYTESNPKDYLDINQYYGLLRVAGIALDDDFPIQSWEMDIGGGVVQQKGNNEYSSGAFTFAMKINPTDWLGLEFRPAWYRPQERTIGDYDLSASVGWRYVRLRGGYRWLWLQGEGTWLDGPYAGISLSF